MTAHSKETIRKFCELCNWALQAWSLRKFLFDNEEYNKFLQTPLHYDFFNRLQIISQEYWLLQLTKLHDPAVTRNDINLSIDYIVDYGQWDQSVKSELATLRSTMKELFNCTQPARNKVICHNDMRALLEGKSLGQFAPGHDEKYFECLKIFAETISGIVLNEPFVWDDLVQNDVEVFMETFIRGESQRGSRL